MNEKVDGRTGEPLPAVPDVGITKLIAEAREVARTIRITEPLIARGVIGRLTCVLEREHTARKVAEQENAVLTEMIDEMNTGSALSADNLRGVVEAAQWLYDNIGVYGTNEICMCAHDTEDCCARVDEYCVKCRLEPALAALSTLQSD